MLHEGVAVLITKHFKDPQTVEDIGVIRGFIDESNYIIEVKYPRKFDSDYSCMVFNISDFRRMK